MLDDAYSYRRFPREVKNPKRTFPQELTAPPLRLLWGVSAHHCGRGPFAAGHAWVGCSNTIIAMRHEHYDRTRYANVCSPKAGCHAGAGHSGCDSRAPYPKKFMCPRMRV